VSHKVATIDKHYHNGRLGTACKTTIQCSQRSAQADRESGTEHQQCSRSQQGLHTHIWTHQCRAWAIMSKHRKGPTQCTCNLDHNQRFSWAESEGLSTAAFQQRPFNSGLSTAAFQQRPNTSRAPPCFMEPTPHAPCPMHDHKHANASPCALTPNPNDTRRVTARAHTQRTKPSQGHRHRPSRKHAHTRTSTHMKAQMFDHQWARIAPG
jgi:hypothetical protein